MISRSPRLSLLLPAFLPCCTSSAVPGTAPSGASVPGWGWGRILPLPSCGASCEFSTEPSSCWAVLRGCPHIPAAGGTVRQGMARHRKYRPGCGRERGRAASPAPPRCRPVSPVPSRAQLCSPCLRDVPAGPGGLCRLRWGCWWCFGLFPSHRLHKPLCYSVFQHGRLLGASGHEIPPDL